MNPLTAETMDVYRPLLSLIIYDNRSTEYDYDTRYYIESHPIDAQGRVLEGRPLTQDSISAMVDTFFDRNRTLSTITGLIPPYVLWYDNLPGGTYTLIWHRPAERRPLHFAEALHITDGIAHVPPMLYRVSAGSLHVYALQDDQRPTPDTLLYRGPFHNVNETGHVCLGSAKAKKPEAMTYELVIRYWEEMFWGSVFTHLSGSNPIEGNLNMVWTDLIQHPDRLFPMEVLLTPEKKISSILR